MVTALLISGNIIPFSAQDLESGITDWSNNANATLAQNSAWSHTGVDSLALTAVAGGNMSAQVNASGWGYPIDPGLLYVAQCWTRAVTTVRTINTYVNWFDASHTFISNTFSGNVTNSTTVDTFVATGLLTPPVNAAFAVLGVQVVSPVATEIHKFDTLGIVGPVGNVPQVYGHRTPIHRFRRKQLIVTAPHAIIVPPIRGVQIVKNTNKGLIRRNRKSLVIVGGSGTTSTVAIEAMIGHLHHHRTRGMS